MAVPRLKERFRDEISPRLTERFGYSSVMQVPKVTKVVLNMGVGEAVDDSKALEEAAEQLGLIAGQKPQIRRAKKSVANFKVREGVPVGIRVTLRGDRMYELLDRLTSIALPRIRDFRGISPNSFDGRGNYNVGIREPIIFPEIDYDKVSTVRGSRLCESTVYRALHGLTLTLIKNMVTGVTEGFEKRLEVAGVGYRAALKGKDLELQLGYSHPVTVSPPEGMEFEVPSATQIVVKGISKQQVGQIAANIRDLRKPEPYKGKGISYEGEQIRRKVGKRA